ncbi:hypothetical protein [Streptomyces sp. CAU 1734]|uniref:hypothetical protein n=1 Tax=Streptomyces sp. CAU 1734 TaxID=3140360 RepID=UPI00326181D3
MRQTPETGSDQHEQWHERGHDDRGDERREERTGRLDLSVPQVAGSALAAVAAAVLASRLGVYGTIIGAGVVSVVATCGGSVFQHMFSRTGEQLKVSRVRTPAPAAAPGPVPERAAGRTESGEFGPAATHGTRFRGARRPLAAAAVVFGVAMAGITGYELLSDSGLSGGRGTTVGSAVRGGDDGGGSGTTGPDGGGERNHRTEEEEGPSGGEPGDGERESVPGGKGSDSESGEPGPGDESPGPGSGTETAEKPGDGSASPGATTPETSAPAGEGGGNGDGNGTSPGTGTGESGTAPDPAKSRPGAGSAPGSTPGSGG